MGFMKAALGPRFLAVFFFAVFFAGMHLSFVSVLRSVVVGTGKLLARTWVEGNVS